MAVSPSPATLVLILVIVPLWLAVCLDRLRDDLFLCYSCSSCDRWLSDSLGLARGVLAVLIRSMHGAASV